LTAPAALVAATGLPAASLWRKVTSTSASGPPVALTRLRATPEVADPPPGKTARVLTLQKPSTAAGHLPALAAPAGGAPRSRYPAAQ